MVDVKQAEYVGGWRKGINKEKKSVKEMII